MPPRFETFTIPKDSPYALALHLSDVAHINQSLHTILDYPDQFLVVWEAK